LLAVPPEESIAPRAMQKLPEKKKPSAVQVRGACRMLYPFFHCQSWRQTLRWALKIPFARPVEPDEKHITPGGRCA